VKIGCDSSFYILALA